MLNNWSRNVGFSLIINAKIRSDQSLSCVWLFETPWIAARQASLSITNSEFTETHVHWVSDAIQPSHPLSFPSPPAPNPSQHQKGTLYFLLWPHVHFSFCAFTTGILTCKMAYKTSNVRSICHVTSLSYRCRSKIKYIFDFIIQTIRITWTLVNSPCPLFICSSIFVIFLQFILLKV